MGIRPQARRQGDGGGRRPPADLTCRDLVEFLDDYVDGSLAADERRCFESHLAVCPECVSYLESYRATARLGREAWAAEDAEPPDAPRALVDAILDARRRSRSGEGS